MFNSLHLNNILNYIFLKHPEQKNMTYIEHLKHAFSYSIQALGCSIIFAVHGFIPCLFKKTGSIMINQMNNQLNKSDINETSEMNEMNEANEVNEANEANEANEITKKNE